MTMPATTAPRIAERDTATGIPIAIIANGSQRRARERVVSKRPACSASGIAMAMTHPNSIGWVAVPDGRLKPARSWIVTRSTFSYSPGMRFG
jgi:hypothetical protein